MKTLQKEQQAYLKTAFGNRVNFSLNERKQYSHDIGAMPGLAKPLIGKTIPAGVVQPESEKELIELVRWAVSNKIPLTPRGKASSGYGGVLPLKGGLVVDFHRLNRVIEVNKKDNTVTVQAGIVWEKLDAELAKSGLTLRLYPSSYPSSTAGGWLAQGGAGIGSYEAGWFKDNVVHARVVLPDGSVRDFSGAELDVISDAEGTTGFISELTIRIRPLTELDVAAASFKTADDLQTFIESIVSAGLPLWSILFINPRMAAMKNQAPLKEHYGVVSEKKLTLPEAYIVTLTFDRKDIPAVMGKLPALIAASHGELLSSEIAEHEWENRFKIMMVKRLGPSLIPVEAVMPLSRLGKTINEINKKVTQPVIKEGIVIRRGAGGQPEVTILGFIPADQRKFNYNFVFSLALSVFKIVEKYGGRRYATGLYFAEKAPAILGAERVRQLKSFKAENDPQNLFNPGKVIQPGKFGAFLAMASAFEPLLRPVANRIALTIGERPNKPVRGIPADIAWYAYGCSQCGYCVAECDQFYCRGWESQSPRGKWYWLREYMEGRAEWDQSVIDTFIGCTTCELCNLRCCASLPIESSWSKLRGQLITEKKRMTFPPFEIMAASLTKEGDIWAGYRRDRVNWFPKELEEKHGPAHKAKAIYFAGCTASYVEQDIAMASVRLLDAAGIDFSYLGEMENCCGTPMMVAGKWDVFKDIMRQNIAAVKAAGADTVITSCPACDMMWRKVYPHWAKKMGIEFGINTKHYSEVIAEKIKSGEFAFPNNNCAPCKVTWHDSCHIGRVSGIYDPPRELIKALPDVELVEMSHSREKAHCCGSVLTLLKEPPVAADVGKVRLDEAMETGAGKVIALCPCCEFQLRVSADKKQVPVEVVDLARFAASYLGFNFPNPNPEVQKQWAVFEAMIALMTPEGFARLMGAIWPELINAMPFGMGPMMRFMGKVPGALNLMKPMFPILFPRLLPMMMPKVMPAMLEHVAAIVPMPDYMKEQMPELMPKVMDNLMPHMIGDVVPLVTQPMIDYLKGKKA